MEVAWSALYSAGTSTQNSKPLSNHSPSRRSSRKDRTMIVIDPKSPRVRS
ncbi:MAG: hypothetical protein F7B06_01150 [Opitutae bacterium]|nr:hypothetical protein [Opitutae bacterium]